jgi:thioredoxin reductase (NADPH)
VSNGSSWPLARRPYSLETSMPGVFAAGDVRRSSVKRVASAVGEGSIAIRLVQQHLAVQRPVAVGARDTRSGLEAAPL